MKYFALFLLCVKIDIMIRIISGKYKGKKINETQDFSVTRPTMDRIKESMFGILQHIIPDAKVLDLFSGTGNLGIEALSNHAKMCTFVDSNKKACEIIKANLKIVGAEAEVLQLDFLDALSRFAGKGVKFDIIFLDPPYSTDFGIKAISEVKEKHLLSEGGVIVFETDRDLKEECEKFFDTDERKYGAKRLYILQNN